MRFLVIFSITLSPLLQAAQEKVGCPTDNQHDYLGDIDVFRDLGYIERACKIVAMAQMPYGSGRENHAIYNCDRAMTLQQASAICKQLVPAGNGDLIAWGLDIRSGMYFQEHLCYCETSKQDLVVLR